MYQNETTPLTEKGVAQAHQVAKRLKNKSINLIYSSTHVRAHETAKIIAKSTGATIELSADLTEIRRPKEVRGKFDSDPKIQKIMQEVILNFANPDWKYSDEENFFDLYKRAEKVLTHLVKNHSGQTILCVSHGTFIKFLAFVAVFGEKLTPELFMHMRHSFYAENTGITELNMEKKGKWRLHTWNDMSHL
jgi:broad specificity phosphatase PhoE